MALRYYLKQNGLATTATGGGDVLVKPTAPNSDAVQAFESGQIAGASEPAPYDVEMVKDGGKVLLSEPGVTTVLMVTQSFLSAHPAIVADLLKANLQALDLIKSDPTKAETDADAEYASYTGKAIKSVAGGRVVPADRTSPPTRTRRRSPPTRPRRSASACSRSRSA